VKAGWIVRVLWLSSLLSCAVLTTAACNRQPMQPPPESFRQFVIANGLQMEYRELEQFLYQKGVRDIVPTWKLLQQGRDWRQHEQQQYAFPDEEKWERMARTLVFLKSELIPYIGPVEVFSGFRTKMFNHLAGGAPRSRHLSFSALELQPVRPIERQRLHAILQKVWHKRGKKHNVGMGLYSGVLFHIDTGGYRQW